jgi:dienelactone hydrolase
MRGTLRSHLTRAASARARAHRAHYDPSQIIEDYSNAVSYLLTCGDIDPARIGLVGVCMGGGYTVSTAARDKRAKAVVSVAGGYDIGGTFQQLMGPEGFAAYYAKVNALRTKEYQTGEVQYIPTIAPGLS